MKDDGHDHSHDLTHSGSIRKVYLPALISFIALMSGISFDYFNASFFNGWIRIVWYVVAYVPVGLPIIKEAFAALSKGKVFTEFFLNEHCYNWSICNRRISPKVLQ